MNSPDSAFYTQQNTYNIEKIIKSNSIIDVARELGLSVGKNVIPCIKRENHVNRNGAPSLTFNLIKNTFRCWVCPDVGGNIIDLVMLVKKVDREKAVDFLSIRSEINPDNAQGSNRLNTNNFSRQAGAKIYPAEREIIFKDFLEGLDNGRGIDLIAFASTKGGTGKSLIVNNLAVIISLISRYIGRHRESKPQTVELIDLDFGKPDQRLLLGIEPEYFIEDIFYQRPKHLTWQKLRQNTPAENLKLVSSCPVRKSNALYYLRKNEILYLLHNSGAHIKLADFGGGSDKETLDFLSSIRSKIFVINPDRASVEAAFNLILSLLYYPMKQRFKGSNDALTSVEKLRNCQRNGFTIDHLRESFRRIDAKRSVDNQFKPFYDNTVRPFKKELGIADTSNGSPSVAMLKEELPIIQEKVFQVLFRKNGINGEFTYSEKSSIYRTFTLIEQTIRKYDPFEKRLDDLLQTSLFGLIINKCERKAAETIAGELSNRISDVFSMRLSNLGNIPEERALRNISNYRMPFIVFDPEHSVLANFFSITDTIIGLKNGSTEKIMCNQRNYLASLKKHWSENVRHAVPVPDTPLE